MRLDERLLPAVAESGADCQGYGLSSSRPFYAQATACDMAYTERRLASVRAHAQRLFAAGGSQKRAGWRSTRRCRSCAFESGGLYNVLHSPHMERASARLNGRSSSSGGGLGSRRADVTVVPLRSAEPMSERAHTAQENGAAWPFFSTPKNSMPNAATRDRLPCAIVTVELAG